jgi:hypothetical protein
MPEGPGTNCRDCGGVVQVQEVPALIFCHVDLAALRIRFKAGGHDENACDLCGQKH